MSRSIPALPSAPGRRDRCCCAAPPRIAVATQREQVAEGPARKNRRQSRRTPCRRGRDQDRVPAPARMQALAGRPPSPPPGRPATAAAPRRPGGADCTAMRIELAMPSSQPRLITIVTARWRSDDAIILRVRTEHDGYRLAGDERGVGDELVQHGFAAQPHQLLDAAEARPGPRRRGSAACSPRSTVFHGLPSLPAALQEDTVRRLETTIFSRESAAIWPSPCREWCARRLGVGKSERQTVQAWKVHKFGGSSVADAACMQRVARIIEADTAPRKAVVLSACRGVTDALLSLDCDSPSRTIPRAG